MIKTYSFRDYPFQAERHETFDDETAVRDMFWCPQKGDCIFDIGAAFGSYSLAALAIGAKRVFAWEPFSECSAPLKMNALINGWHSKVAVFDYGLYYKEGFLGPFDNHYLPLAQEKTAKCDIPVRTMDEWYKDVFLPIFGREEYGSFWMKIDVEGAEVGVLLGAEKLIRQLKPYILVENHLFIRDTIEREVNGFIKSLDIYDRAYSAPYHSVSHSLFVPKGYPFDIDQAKIASVVASPTP